MKGTKPIFGSKSILGLVILLAVFVFQKFEIQITEAEIQKFTELGLELFGMALAFYGRISATKKITSL